MTKNGKKKNDQIEELRKTTNYGLPLSILCLYSHDWRTKGFFALSYLQIVLYLEYQEMDCKYYFLDTIHFWEIVWWVNYAFTVKGQETL